MAGTERTYGIRKFVVGACVARLVAEEPWFAFRRSARDVVAITAAPVESMEETKPVPDFMHHASKSVQGYMVRRRLLAETNTSTRRRHLFVSEYVQGYFE